MATYSEWRRKQNAADKKAYEKEARATIKLAKQGKKKKEEYTDLGLNDLAYRAERLRETTGNKSRTTREALSLLKKAVSADKDYREASKKITTTRGRATTPSFSASNEKPANPFEAQRQGMTQIANARFQAKVDDYRKAQQEEENKRKASLYKYGDVDNMSSKELGDRIKKLEAEKKQRADIRNQDTAVKGYNSSGSGAGGGQISALLNNKGLSRSQLETMNKLDADADDKLSVYRNALVNATIRDEEKKLTGNDKIRLQKAADQIRHLDSVQDENGNWTPAIDPNMITERNNKVRASVEDLKKRGIDTDYLIEAYGTQMDNEDAERTAKDLKEWAGDNWFNGLLASVGTVVASPITGLLDAPADIYHAVRNSGTDKPVPVNEKYRLAGNLSQSAREGVSENIENPVWNFIYNAGMSTADSAMAIATGAALGGASIGTKATQAIMSINAADQTYDEAVKRGLDPMNALATAITAGVTEWVTEKYSIDGFKKMAMNRPDKLRTLVTNIGKQMATEGSEEAASDVLNTIADNVINGKKSEYNQNVKRYLDQGLTQQQAKKAAMMDWLSNTAYDAAAGAFSGALMGAGGQAMSFNQVQNDIEKYGGNIKKGGDLKAVIDYAAKFEGLEKLAKKADKTANDSKTVGKIAEAVEKKVNERVAEAETAEELGQIYEELRDEAPDTIGIQIDAAVREKAAELSKEAVEEDKEALDNLKGIAEESLMNASERMGRKIEESENETEMGTVYDENNGRTYEVQPEVTTQGMDMGEEIQPQTEKEQKESNERVSEEAKAPLKILNHRTATLDASGERVTIEGIEGTGTKDVRLKIDGHTDEVPLSDVHFESRAVEQIYRIASTMDDSAAATAMISNYDGKQDTRNYALDFDRAYNWGSAMMSYDSLRQKFAFSTPEHIVKMAYYLGQNAAEKNFDEAHIESQMIKEGKKTFKKGTGKAIDERTDEYAKGDIYSNIDKAMAKKIGITVRSVDDIKPDEKEVVGTINGYFDAANAEMRFSEMAESKLGVRIHESMEFLEKVDPDLYKMTIGAVLKYALDSNNAKSIYDEIINYRNVYRDVEGKKTFAEATEEYINDAISGAFMSEDGAKDFINWLGKENFSANEKKGILKTIADMINGLIEKIKDALNMGGLTKAQQKIANTSLEKQQTIRNLFTQAMDSAIDTYKNGSSTEVSTKAPESAAASIAHAIKTNIDASEETINKNIESVARMQPIMTISDDTLSDNGENLIKRAKEYFDENVPLLINSEEIGDVETTRSGVGHDLGHGYGREKVITIVSVPDVTKDGKMVFHKKNWKNRGYDRIVLAAPITVTGDSEYSGEYMVGVAVNRYTRSKEQKYHIHEAVSIKIDEASIDSGLAKGENSANASPIKSILRKIINVKKSIEGIDIKNMSTRQLDEAYETAISEKNEERLEELVKEAATRAGYDSPTLYHGTEKTGFTEFDLGKMDDGISIFTTESADMAAGYSGRKVIKTLEAAKKKENGEEVFKRGNKEEILEFFRNNLSNDAEYATRLDLRDDTTYSMQSVKSAARSIENLLGEYEDGSEDHKNAKAVVEALKVFEKWYDAKTEEQMEKIDLEKALEQYNEAYEKAPEKASDVLIRKGLAGELSFIVKKSTDDPQKYIKLKDEGRGLIDVDTLTFMSTDPGIYKMYGKTDNMLIVDGKGNSWNEIPIPQAIKNEIGDDSATTRELSQFAKDKGYNGVVIENIADNGGKWTDSRGYDKSTVRIFFDPSDVKSADNITYDEEGKIIPLSERFNTEKKDLRFSVKVDSLGDIEEKAVEHFGTTEDFKYAGYMLPDGRLLDFSGAHYMESEGEKDQFRKTTNMRTVDHEDIFEVMDASGDNRKQFMDRGNIRISPEAPGINISTKAEPTAAQYRELKEFIRETQKNPDYDGTSFYVDLEDTAPHKVAYAGKINADKIINDIKSYFKTGTMPEGSGLDSFRYSLSDTKETSDILKENKELQEMVSNLKKEFELTGGTMPDQKKIKSAARKILKKYSSEFDLDTLTENITNVYSYLRQDGADFDEAVRVMSEIARGVLERTEIKDDTMSKQYEDLKKQIKAGVNFTDLQREELSHAGGITAFTHRSGIRSSKQTIDLDRQWAEWSTLYPELFPADTNEGDMPFVLEGILEAISPQIETLNGETIDQMAYDVAMQIYSEIAKVPVKETFADKKEREKYEALQHVAETYEDLVEAYRKNNTAQNEEDLKETLEQVKKERTQRIARLIDEVNDLNTAKKYAGNPKTLEQYKKEIEKKGAQIAHLKAQNDEKIAELRQKYQGQRAKQAETRRQTEQKDKIRRLHEKFRRMILKPTETMHVPAELMQSAIEVCEVVNLGAKKGTKLFDALYDAERAFGRIKNDTETYGIDDFDPRIAGDLARLTDLFHEKGDDWSIYDMTSKELEQVYDAMSEIYESIRLSTKLIREEGEKDVRRAGKKVIKELQQSKGVKDHWWSRAANRVSSSFLNSQREFRRLSGYNDESEIMDMWRELNEGQRRQYQIQMDGENFIQQATLAEGMEDLMKEIDSDKALVKVPLRFEKGTAPVMVTKGMRLAIILHGMSTANRLHMMEGGMMIPDMSKYQSDKKRAYEKSRKVVGITSAALMQMEAELSTKERTLLNTFADFFHNWTGDLINKTSMDLYGFKKARVENYYPIYVDQDFVATDISALKFDKTIEGAGFLKERVRSTNPIILESVIDTADRSLNAVSLFSGLAIPIRNFNKIMNVSTYKATEGDSEAFGGKGWTVDTSVKKEIEEIWGSRTQKYIDDMLSDLQQGRRSEASLYDKLRGNYAGAVLTANASVIIKQTSAYPMCAAITGWSPTLKAMFRGGKNNWILSKADQELINEYTPIYWERNKGNSTRELAEIREYGTGIAKLPPVRLVKDAIQKVDMAMVGRFWYAAQYYINSTQKELAKKFKADPNNKRIRDQYYSEVAKVFDRCVGETQSTNMVLQNADIMRNTSASTKIITMFMGQGLQNFGVVYDSINNLRAKRAQYKNGTIEKSVYTQAKKDVANALSSQFVSAAMFAGLAIVARALLHRMNPYRDDKEEITGETILSKWWDDLLDNIIGSVPLGSFTYEWASAVIDAANGNGWVRPYGQNDIVLQSLSDLESSTVNLFKAISKGEGIGEAINEVAKDGSKLFGVPWENVSNLFEGTMKHIQDVTEGEGPLSFTSDQKNPAEKKVINYLTEAIQQKNDAAVEKYVEMLYDLGKNAKDINGLLAKPLKQDETVKAAAAAKEQGDLAAYEKTVTDFEKKGYPRDAVIKAINGIITEKKKKEKPDPEVTKERALETAGSLYGSLKINEEKLYKNSDLQAAVETGKGIDAVVKELLKEKLDTGLEKEEAVKKVATNIKKALKGYKEEYLDGNAHERTQIIKKLQKIKVDGNIIYDQDLFLRWNKEADKQKK